MFKLADGIHPVTSLHQKGLPVLTRRADRIGGSRLPDGFDYALAGRDQRRPLSDWVDLGVTDAFGRALPRLDLRAALLVPSGHDGPAFLAYDNFDVIMRWNRSEFYALSVGRLADEIAGAIETI